MHATFPVGPVRPLSIRRAIAATLLAAGAIAASTMSASAVAQDYPSRPLRFVVGSAAGSVSDVWARRYAQRLTPLLGQSIVVENKPGASGSIAMQSVAQAAPDGYTVMFSGLNEMGYAPASGAKLPYDIERDLVPIASGPIGYGFIVSRPDLGIGNLAQLAEFARKRGKPLICATAGNATSQHFGCAAVARALGLEMTYVPYKGSGPALADLIAGQADLAIAFGVEVLALGNRVVPLAILGPTRSPAFPAVPTALESGVTAVDCIGWVGLVLPRGAPDAVAARLNDAMQQVNREQVVRDWLAQGGGILYAHDPSQSAAFIGDVRKQLTRLAREARITVPD